MTTRGKVSGPKRLRSGSWQIRWRDPNAPPGKNQRKASYPSEREADRHKKLIEADLLRGTYVDMANPTTVAQYAWQWVAARPLRPRTQEHYGSFIRDHLESDPLGPRPLAKVRPSEIQAWITRQAKPHGTLGPSTLNVWVGILRSIFAAAVLDRLILSNPVLPKKYLKMPSDDRPKFVPLTVDQVLVLAAGMPERYRALVLVQAGLGLRIGELLGLELEDVDFLKREVHIQRQADQKTLERVAVKTRYSDRVIPLPPKVAEVLAEQIREFPPAEDGRIFTNGPGGPQWGGRPVAEGSCPVEEILDKPCGRPVRARGMCDMHYTRWLRSGTTDAPAIRGWTADPKWCPVMERAKRCGRPAISRGWCKLHYSRWHRRGTTDPPPPSSRKERVSYQQYGEQLARAAAAAGLPPGTSSHDLRHHYATVLLHKGLSAHEVAERLGHADATLVLKTYGHVMPNSEDRTRHAVDEAWAEAEARRHAEEAEDSAT